MDAKSITYKSENELSEVKYLVEAYLKEVKGVEVQVSLRSEEMSHQGVVYYDQREFDLLFKAFWEAKAYFIKKYNSEKN